MEFVLQPITISYLVIFVVIFSAAWAETVKVRYYLYPDTQEAKPFFVNYYFLTKPQYGVVGELIYFEGKTYEVINSVHQNKTNHVYIKLVQS